MLTFPKSNCCRDLKMLRLFLSGGGRGGKDNHKPFPVMMVIQFIVCVCSGEKCIPINVQTDCFTAENVALMWLLSNG